MAALMVDVMVDVMAALMDVLKAWRMAEKMVVLAEMTVASRAAKVENSADLSDSSEKMLVGMTVDVTAAWRVSELAVQLAELKVW